MSIHIEKTFNRDEIIKIRKALLKGKNSSRNMALFNVQIDTMLRTSVIRYITVSDVQSRNIGEIKEKILVKTRNKGKPVTCYLTKETRESLKDWICISGKNNNDYLFTGRKNPNHPISDTHHRHLLREWCKEAGVDSTKRSTTSIKNHKLNIAYELTHDHDHMNKMIMNDSFNFNETFHSIWVTDEYLELRKEGWGFLYVMEGLDPKTFDSVGIYKIGITTNINERLYRLERDNLTYPKMEIYPKLIKALFIENPALAESALHSIFDGHRIGGEWFRLNASDLFLLMLMNKETIENLRLFKFSI